MRLGSSWGVIAGASRVVNGQPEQEGKLLCGCVCVSVGTGGPGGGGGLSAAMRDKRVCSWPSTAVGAGCLTMFAAYRWK